MAAGGEGVADNCGFPAVTDALPKLQWVEKALWFLNLLLSGSPAAAEPQHCNPLKSGPEPTVHARLASVNTQTSPWKHQHCRQPRGVGRAARGSHALCFHNFPSWLFSDICSVTFPLNSSPSCQPDVLLPHLLFATTTSLHLTCSPGRTTTRTATRPPGAFVPTTVVVASANPRAFSAPTRPLCFDTKVAFVSHLLGGRASSPIVPNRYHKQL